MKIHLQKFTIAYFFIWLAFFVLGIIIPFGNNYPIQYFTISLGLTSLLILLVFWWSGTGEIAKTSTSILITLVAYALKFFISTVIFIYYFHIHQENVEIAFFTGFGIFIIYSVLEVAYGLRLTEKK